MLKTYAVKEIFLTLQGEGSHSGTPAIFVRFTGCNVWSGHAEHRERDAAKGTCARWCDTDFVGTDGVLGGRYTAEKLVATIRELWNSTDRGIVVCTGGEPGLQLDDALVAALHLARFDVHVETNGSIDLPETVDWITLSPKPPMPVTPSMLQRANDVKVVYPVRDLHPADWLRDHGHHYIQPIAQRAPDDAVAFVLDSRGAWRLSLQTHKLLNLP